MANKLYRAVETAITFKDSGGDKALALNGQTLGTGQVSAIYDRGAGSLADLHEVSAVIQWTAAPTFGDAAEIYLFQSSDGTIIDGNVGTTSASFLTNKRKNGMLIGAVICDVESGSVNMVGRFMNVPITSRYYSIGVWNGSATKAFLASANVSYVIVTPMPPELQ